MCGRAACGLSPDEFQRIVGQNKPLKEWRNEKAYNPNYNATPGTFLPVMYYQQYNNLSYTKKEKNLTTSPKTEANVVKKEPESSSNTTQAILHTMRWGLTPAFTPQERAEELGARLFNARADTLRSKSSLKHLISRNRCVFFAQGFFEWHHSKGHKQPYFFQPDSPNTCLLCMAGLYDVWTDPETGQDKHTFTIITVDPSKDVSWIHDRMPAILQSDEDIETWLDTTISPEKALSVLQPATAGFLNYYRVSNAVSKAQNHGKQCIRPVDSPNNGLHRFFDINSKSKKEKEVKTENTTDSRKRDSPDESNDQDYQYQPPQKKIKTEE